MMIPDLAKDVVPDRRNQLLVAHLTYVAIPGGFIYLAAILDAWSRKVSAMRSANRWPPGSLLLP